MKTLTISVEQGIGNAFDLRCEQQKWKPVEVIRRMIEAVVGGTDFPLRPEVLRHFQRHTAGEGSEWKRGFAVKLEESMIRNFKQFCQSIGMSVMQAMRLLMLNELYGSPLVLAGGSISKAA